MKLLNEWLHSDSDLVRRNGEACLFSLLKPFYDHSKIQNSQLENKLAEVVNKLVHSENPSVRRILISITQKLISFLRAKMGSYGEESKVQQCIKLMNENLKKLMDVFESDTLNLCFMFYVIFDYISFPNESLLEEGSAYRETLSTTPSLFLDGKMIINFHLLHLVDLAILRHIFLGLPCRGFSSLRLTLLHLIIHKFGQEKIDLENELFGMRFFRGLLNDTNPKIAYHASGFLLTQMQKERPDEYQSILTSLLAKAQETNDEQMLANPYMQIQEMISLSKK
eukprot:TRINITY_DN3087_c0_g1_i1.p1 TRINITY_DN3087_c0_g1~~TRINITY_DN3087_c0_g1_i1.p1  ORF type:complete len:281 (+),score=79.75 TRINITY_DN3087_c0_g1_i1:516-1358(+)